MQDDALILGATGRTGRAIAEDLDARGIPLVLAGRDRARLERVAAALHGEPRIVVGSFEEQVAAIGAAAPGVVVNTVGPFTRTALTVVRALPDGTHYLDLSNEYASIDELLRLDRSAARAGRSIVPGAGFGVTGSESVVVRLCEGRPRPSRVHVDAMPSLAMSAGTLGTALADTIAEVAAFGGGTVRGGRFVRTASVVSGTQTLTTPDGDRITTATGPSGELRAAWLASDADDVTAGSTLAPTSPIVRAVMPAMTAVFRVGPIRRFVVSRIARIVTKRQPMARQHSWTHARAEWPSGEVHHGWLRLGDAEEYTTEVASEVAARLLRGEGTPGVSTPATMFGSGLAESVGAEYVTEEH